MNCFLSNKLKSQGIALSRWLIQPPEQFRDTDKPTPPPRTGKWESVKPKPVPRKMVNEYEDIIQPPEQFRDGYKPIPKPRTDRSLKMQNA